MSTGGVSPENTAPMDSGAAAVAVSPSAAASAMESTFGGLLEGTRFADGVGRPEMAGAQSSNQGAVAGSTGSADGNGNINRAGGDDPIKGGTRRRHRRRHYRGGGCGVTAVGGTRRRHKRGRRHSRVSRRRGMRGGAGILYSTAPTEASLSGMTLGPRAGYMELSQISNCGTHADTNLKQLGGGVGDSGLVGSANYGFTGGDPALMADLRGSYAPISGNTYNQQGDCYRGGSLGSAAEGELSMKDNVPNSQDGGRRRSRSFTCSDLRRVHHFAQVRRFLSSVCPSVVMIYNSFLKKHEGSHNHKVAARLKKIVVAYTKAFCHEVAARRSKNVRGCRRELRAMKSALAHAGAELRRMEPAAENAHAIMVKHRLAMVHQHLHHISTMKKHRGSRHRRTHRRRTMRGGYHQFGSNIPNTGSMSIGGVLSASESAMSNPPPFGVNPLCDNCVDNYNHFTGKGSESPVLDQDVGGH